MKNASISKVLCAVGCILALAGCGKPAMEAARGIDPSRFDGPRAFDEVRRFLAVGPRVAGTAGAERAAQYLKSRLGELGIPASIDQFTDVTESGAKVFRNVIGEVPGTIDPTVLVVCHYDTKSGIEPEFQGANDSGSGVGVLMELGRVLKSGRWPGPRVRLAFLDGEECELQYDSRDGLRGSRHLAGKSRRDGQLAKVQAVIVVDMVGDRDLTVTVPRNSSPDLVSAVFQAAEAEGARRKFALYPPVLDDHVPFLEAGLRAVDIMDFEYGSAPGRNDYWHTPADTLDKLSPESLQVVGRVVLRVLYGLRDEASVR